LIARQILQAVARKVLLSQTVDIGAIAAATEGYSGADLQALLYNAHLEVVHSSIAGTSLDDRPSTREEDGPVQFTVIGGSQAKVTSKADEMALQRRASLPFHFSSLGISPTNFIRLQLRQIKSKALAKTDQPKGVLSTPKTVCPSFPLIDIF
jgi:SpoVK/Ycf46/Vps4 family AAA+-type ATPase